MMLVVIESRRATATANRDEFEEGSYLRVDGSWSHRTDASEHIIDFIDSDTGKAVDLDI
jgi:hypothetical protein